MKISRWRKGSEPKEGDKTAAQYQEGATASKARDRLRGLWGHQDSDLSPEESVLAAYADAQGGAREAGTGVDGADGAAAAAGATAAAESYGSGRIARERLNGLLTERQANGEISVPEAAEPELSAAASAHMRLNTVFMDSDEYRRRKAMAAAAAAVAVACAATPADAAKATVAVQEADEVDEAEDADESDELLLTIKAPGRKTDLNAGDLLQGGGSAGDGAAAAAREGAGSAAMSGVGTGGGAVTAAASDAVAAGQSARRQGSEVNTVFYPVVVYTPEELDEARRSGAERILVKGELARKLRTAFKGLRSIGAGSLNLLALGLSGAALFAPFTGGVTLGAAGTAMGTLGAALTAAAIAAISAIGFTLVIAVFKGYEEVRLGGGGVELVIRKGKKSSQ